MFNKLLNKSGFVNHLEFTFPFESSVFIEKFNGILVKNPESELNIPLRSDNKSSLNFKMNGSVEQSQFFAENVPTHPFESTPGSIRGKIIDAGKSCKVQVEIQSFATAVSKILGFTLFTWIIITALIFGSPYLLGIPPRPSMLGFFFPTLVYFIPLILFKIFANQFNESIVSEFRKFGASSVEKLEDFNEDQGLHLMSQSKSKGRITLIRQKWVLGFGGIWIGSFVAFFIGVFKFTFFPILLGCLSLISCIGLINKSFRQQIFKEEILESDQKRNLGIIFGVTTIMCFVFTILLLS